MNKPLSTALSVWSRALSLALPAGLALLLGVAGNGQEPKPVTADTVKEIQAKFKAERADFETRGLGKVFSPEWLGRADALAKSADAALAANRLIEAIDSYRKARQELPGLPD